MGRGRECWGGGVEGGREREGGIGAQESTSFFFKMFICISDLFHIGCVGRNKRVNWN